MTQGSVSGDAGGGESRVRGDTGHGDLRRGARRGLVTSSPVTGAVTPGARVTIHYRGRAARDLSPPELGVTPGVVRTSETSERAGRVLCDVNIEHNSSTQHQSAGHLPCVYINNQPPRPWPSRGQAQPTPDPESRTAITISNPNNQDRSVFLS